jgi:hypothetical protein
MKLMRFRQVCVLLHILVANKYNIYFFEHTAVVVTLYTRIREVLCSNLGRNVCYPN